MQAASSHQHYPDDEFLARFFAGSLPPEVFSHEAHFRLAWICLNRFSLLEAIQKVCQGIQQFDRMHGDGTKYNETLTLGLVLLVHEQSGKHPTPNWQEFIQQNETLLSNWRQILLQYYQESTLFSSESAKHFVLPDKGAMGKG